MSYWDTSSTLRADVLPSTVWVMAYADVQAWPRWNTEIASVRLRGPLAWGAKARIVFRSGLRLPFNVVEYIEGQLFTDEARLPGARMGHRHLVESDQDGCLLTNTIYIGGMFAALWRRVLGPAAIRTLPEAQRAIVALALVAPMSSELVDCE